MGGGCHGGISIKVFKGVGKAEIVHHGGGDLEGATIPFPHPGKGLIIHQGFFPVSFKNTRDLRKKSDCFRCKKISQKLNFKCEQSER